MSVFISFNDKFNLKFQVRGKSKDKVDTILKDNNFRYEIFNTGIFKTKEVIVYGVTIRQAYLIKMLIKQGDINQY